MNNKRKSSSNQLAKECIVSALLQLIQEKTLTSINISELCKRAGVSRMTFYRNYESKEDIFIKHLDEIFENYKMDDATMNMVGTYCDETHMNHYFDSLYIHRNFLDGLIQCGFDVIFLNKLNDYVNEKWGNTEDKYRLAAFTGALYNMFHLWSANGYAEEKTVLITKMVELFYTNKGDVK